MKDSRFQHVHFLIFVEYSPISWKLLQFQLNFEKIKKCYLKKNSFESDYPIIKFLLILKQKHPEIDLLQLSRFNNDIFTTKSLTKVLYGITDQNHTAFL